jgi:hypothetical protein
MTNLKESKGIMQLWETIINKMTRSSIETSVSNIHHLYVNTPRDTNKLIKRKTIQKIRCETVSINIQLQKNKEKNIYKKRK